MKISLLLLFACIGTCTVAQNTVCFTVEANPNISDPALAVFSKYVDVYGCSIYAESTISDEKVLHAAAVWAELIDNDEDGIIDDPTLLSMLVYNEAFMPIFHTDGNSAMMTFDANYMGSGVSALLFNDEIDPSQTGHWGADASVEEIMHTINHVGHVNIEPTVFGLAPNSSLLSQAMDSARGGQWITMPATYPASAWYHYDDATCDYQCMAIEYLYWMQVTNMNILNDPTTCAGIANEWEPCSPALLQSMDVLGYALTTDPANKLPQNAPDGNYCPSTIGVQEEAPSPFQVYPNPADNSITINSNQSSGEWIVLKNTLGQVVVQKAHFSSVVTLDVSHLTSGIYFLSIGVASHKLIIK